MIASLLCFDVLHLSEKKYAGSERKKKSFLERLRFHNLASFEVETAKVSCYCIGAEGIFFMPQLRGWGEG